MKASSSLALSSFQLISCHFGRSSDLLRYYSTAPSFSHPFYDITTNKGMYVRVRGEKLVQQLHAVVLLLTPPIWKLWANRIGGLVVGWLAEWPFSSLSYDTAAAVLKFMSLGNGIERTLFRLVARQSAIFSLKMKLTFEERMDQLL